MFRTPYKSSTFDGDPVKQKALTTWLSGGFVSNQLKIPPLQHPVKECIIKLCTNCHPFQFWIETAKSNHMISQFSVSWFYPPISHSCSPLSFTYSPHASVASYQSLISWACTITVCMCLQLRFLIFQSLVTNFKGVNEFLWAIRVSICSKVLIGYFKRVSIQK